MIECKYKPIPFWSWNDDLDINELVNQVDWMYESGIGGFFMHARGGLLTPYEGEHWFKCVEACLKRAKEFGMEPFAYDENGWPSGFCDGRVIENEMFRDTYLTYKYGEYDPKSLVSYLYGGEKLVRTTSGKDCLNIYFNVSNSTADICNPEAMDKFIELTHEEYRKHDIYGNLKGFFTDEPQLYRWATSYSRMLPGYFKEHYGQDILDGVGLLFIDREGYRDFRYKYYKALQDLMLNNFTKKIYDWCDKYNYKLTGHFVEETQLGFQVSCNGGIMPHYEYEHIPGIDMLGRSIPDNELAGKQVGTVAAQLGKEQVLAEIFALAGWDATPLELKHIAENVMVNGVTLVCHHLLPYSEHGQRKRDYPEHYSKHNPWVEKNFASFNDYLSEIGKLLSNSTEIANVGIITPVTSCYFDYKREEPGYGCANVNDHFLEDLDTLTSHHISHHILDEVIMAKHAKVEGKKLIVGNCSYDYVILPCVIYTMDESTDKLLKEYVKNGGKILLLGEKPTYLAGQEHTYDYLKSNCTFEEIIDSLPYESDVNNDFRITYRKDKDGKEFLYVVNYKDEADFRIKFKNFNGFICNGKPVSSNLHFEKYGSMILYPSNVETPEEKKLDDLHLTNDFSLEKKVQNFLTLDMVSYSKDGINYTDKRYVMAALWEVLESKYQGKMFLKYNFHCECIPDDFSLLIEDMHNANLTVNGVKLEKVGYVLEKDLHKYDISKVAKVGDNEIIVEINFYNNNDVYTALFGETVQESMLNKLAFDTTIEAAYLMGSFGVDGDFKQHKNPEVYYASEFRVVEQNNHITDLILDGFPFFRGDLELITKINVKDINKRLVLDHRFNMVDVYVNDEFVNRMMFSKYLDLSNHLKVGDNNIKLVVSISNRNLLGPHHLSEGESHAVGPCTFERRYSWKDGKSPMYDENYHFVKSFVFKD